jgi:hypothetical protein
MNTVKPKNIEEYKKWFKEKHEIEISDRTQTYYDSVANTIKRNFEESDFWVQLTENLNNYSDEYLVKTGYSLFMPGFGTELNTKPFISFLSKTFRKNILENEHWPNEPNGGWILPNNWYTRISDIVRTMFVVKFLDGVKFMIDKTKSVCEQCNIEECGVSYEAREDGYYAVHLYPKNEFEIPRITWDTEKIDVRIEIQITTQVQEVIRRMLHKYYEYRRERMKKGDIKWQWDYKSDEFVANYLGHILHYVEGMIMEIREKQMEETL